MTPPHPPPLEGGKEESKGVGVGALTSATMVEAKALRSYTQPSTHSSVAASLQLVAVALGSRRCHCGWRKRRH